MAHKRPVFLQDGQHLRAAACSAVLQQPADRCFRFLRRFKDLIRQKAAVFRIL